MRILQLHSDSIEYEPVKKEIADAENVEKKASRLEDVLVLFISVESGDSEKVGEKAIEEINDFLKTIKCNKVLIYPYAHMSRNLASPKEAFNILKSMEKKSKEVGIDVSRAPFGWCKKFSISVKGHPMAEQYKVFGKEIKAEKKLSKALKDEDLLKSFWYIIHPNGKMVPVEKFDFKGHTNLKKFADYEISKSRVVHQMPPHVTLMKKLEIADFEPGSDLGNMRYYPKGRLIKSLLEMFVTQKIIEYGGMEVETPIMYDFQHPILANYLNRFPARQYVVKSDEKEFFLRFSACFGQFLMAKDSQFSYKQLPYRIYELTRYSFRREKSGELVGLRRLRAFTMPDVHALCSDINQVKEEFVTRFNLCKTVLKGCGLDEDDYEMAIRFTKEFYEDNKGFVNALIKELGKPVLVEMWDKKFFYFVLKYEFNFIDNLNKASALSTDQIDVENGERYGILYTDKDDKKHNPIILHCSPSGAIERVIYALLEKKYKESNENKNPLFPLWLSPTQVRLCPMNTELLGFSEELMKKLESNHIRVDIDDRVSRIQKKVRDAEIEWVPFTVVIGNSEKDTGKLSVRMRETGKIEKMTINELALMIKEQTKDYPFKPLSLPNLLSKRPRFV